MKKLLTLLFLVFFICTQAQINVGSRDIAALNSAGKLTDEDLDRLSKTTTLFLLQKQDYDKVDQFQKAISATWKVTKFKIIKPDDVNSYLHQDGYSYFTFGGIVVSGDKIFVVHLTYDLWIPDKFNKNDEVQTCSYYTRIDLAAPVKTMGAVVGQLYNSIRFNTKRKIDEMFPAMDTSELYTWGAGYLKSNLITVNNLLTKHETRGTFTNNANAVALAGLKKDTLFLPKYVKTKFSNLNGREHIPDDASENLISDYRYPVKYVDEKQLNDMILNRTGPINYLVYLREGSDKLISVYNSEKGLIYSHYQPLSYNLKSKDLDKLAKEIE